MTSKSSGPPKKVAKPPSPHYTVGEWAGIPNYRCAYCSFATVDGEEVMRQHLVDRHMNIVQTETERAQALGLIIKRR